MIYGPLSVAEIEAMAHDLEVGTASIEDAASMLHIIAQSLPAPAVAQDGVTGEGTDYLPNRLHNYAAICESRGLLIEASGMRDIAKIIAPLLAENARLREELKGTKRRLDVAMAAKIDERASRERAEADANQLREENANLRQTVHYDTGTAALALKRATRAEADAKRLAEALRRARDDIHTLGETDEMNCASAIARIYDALDSRSTTREPRDGP